MINHSGEEFSDVMHLHEVAAALRLSPNTIMRWADAGKLVTIRTPGGHRCYSRAQVEDIITNRKIGSTDPQEFPGNL